MKVKLDIVNVRSTIYRPAWMIETPVKKEVIAITFKDQMSYYHFIDSEQYADLQQEGIRIYSWRPAPRPKAEIEAEKETYKKMQQNYPELNDVPFHVDHRYLVIHLGSSQKTTAEVLEGIKKYCDSPVLDKFSLAEKKSTAAPQPETKLDNEINLDNQSTLSK